jgi:CheY-like chemotaxis protein
VITLKEGLAMGSAVLKLTDYSGKALFDVEINQETQIADVKEALPRSTNWSEIDIKKALNDISKLTGEKPKSILLIDDDADILETIASSAELEGHFAEFYTNQEIAFSIIKKHPNRFDLIVVDYNMPGMKGDALVKVLSDFISPDCRVAILTGEAPNNLGGLNFKMRVFIKPCAIDKIIEKMF